MKKIIFLFFIFIAAIFSENLYAQAPANDDCSGAIEIPLNTNTTCYTILTGTTLGATQSLPGCSGIADDDVWYKFTTISSYFHDITITPTVTNGINDVNFQLFYPDCAVLTSINCVNYSTGNSPEFALVSGTTGGFTYYLRVYSNSGSTADRGDFEICIKQEINILNVNALNNAGFESPVQSTLGDHIPTTIPEWITNFGTNSNIVKADGTAYTSGPDTAHTGNQYINLQNGDGYIYQYFEITDNISIKYGGWFSRRDAAPGSDFDGYIDIVDNSETVVSFSDTASFTSNENQEVWKKVSRTATLPAGQYAFRVYVNDSANFDSAYVVPFDPNAPSISIAASSTSICANANITFTPTVVNPANISIFYTWLKNGIEVNYYDPVFNTTSLANNDIVSCKIIYTDANGHSQHIISNSIVVSVTTNCYCIPPGGGGFNNDVNISNVTVNGLSNPTSNNTLDSYNDFTSTITFSGQQATAVNFNITTLKFADKSIWIDFNDNMSFDDPGELMFVSPNQSILSYNGSFFMPGNAPVGNHRLRVRSHLVPSVNSCNQAVGETEDYTINISAGANCSGIPSASIIKASQYVVCTGGSTNLTAYANGLGISYQWQKSALPNTGFANITGALNSSYTATAITSNTYYRCLFTCSNSGQSNPSPVLSITVGGVPVNDNVCNAITLMQNVFDTANTTCATVSNENFPGSDECSAPNNTVWYKITPAVTERLRLKLNKLANDPYPVDAWLNIFKASGNCPNPVLTQVSPYPQSCLRANLLNDSSVIVEAGTFTGYPNHPSGILQADSTYYIRIDGYIGSFGAYAITSLTPTVITNTWTGNISDAWENINNWSNLALPDANTNVIINNNAVNYPKLNSNVSIRSLRVTPGSAITVLSGKTLTVLR